MIRFSHEENSWQFTSLAIHPPLGESPLWMNVSVKDARWLVDRGVYIQLIQESGTPANLP